MAEDWRDERYRSDDDRGRRGEGPRGGNPFERNARGGHGGEYGGNDPSRGARGGSSGGGGYGSGRETGDWQGRLGSEYERRYSGEGRRGAGPVSEGTWSDIDRDFSNDWGTGVGDMYGREAGYGSRRNQPGFPSFGRGRQPDVGYDTLSGDAYQDRGGRGYGTSPDYQGGRGRDDFRGRQGAFIGRGGYAGEPVDHFEQHGSGSGYAAGGRRQDEGWFGGPTGERERPSWQAEGQHRGRGPRDYKRSDERIKEDVNDRLADDPWIDASDITVEAKDGEITLSGTVDSREAKRRAEDCAEGVSGVRHCQNNLRVRSQDMRYGQSGDTGQAYGSQNTGGSTPGGSGMGGTTGSGSQASGPSGSQSAANGAPGQTGNRQH